MYKLLLCLRYLRTRYLAFVCIVSVMLGVATLIVVNSVMSGFGNKMKDRLHGILSDIRMETDRPDGFEDSPEVLEAKIRATPAGKHIDCIAPTVETYALMQFSIRDRYGRKIPQMKQVRVIAIDPKKQAELGGFSEFLVRQKNSPNPTFDLTADGRWRFERNRQLELEDPFLQPAPRIEPVQENPLNFLPPIPIVEANPGLPTPTLPKPELAPVVQSRLPGAIIGYSLGHYPYTDPVTGETTDRPILFEGDDILIATVGASGTKPVSATFIVTDYYKSEMSEYDSTFIYVNLEDMQRIRGMDNHVTAMQIKLNEKVRENTEYIHNTIVRDIQELMPRPESMVQSWQQQQGPLLAAIEIERGILNILLFLIIGVAGFGVLAIFSMIVSEKYRDIGVLKSLGASNRGVMAIFLSYGFMLGFVGCVGGTALGLAITDNINEIEMWIAKQSGRQIFDRKIYYFDKIPTNIEISSVTFVNAGAILIAVAFSVIPAFRAARLHPVRALRFE